MLNNIIKLSSLCGALLIFFGFLKLVIFYSFYNIKIVDYISFSEIITSFLDDINILLLFICIMVLQSGPLLNFLHKKSKLRIEEFYDIILATLYKKKLWIILFFLIVISITMILLLKNYMSLNLLVIYLLVFCILQIVTYLLLMKDEEGKFEISTFNLGVSVFIGLVSGVFLLAQHDIEEVKSQNTLVNIETSDSTFECNRNNFWVYLGKTDQFLFLHHLKTKSNVIIHSNELKRIKFITK